MNPIHKENNNKGKTRDLIFNTCKESHKSKDLFIQFSSYSRGGLPAARDSLISLMIAVDSS